MMDETSESDVKQVSDEESDILLFKAFLRVLEELKEDFSLGGNIYFSLFTYVVSSREILIGHFNWVRVSEESGDDDNVVPEESGDASALLEECIEGLYELVDQVVKGGRQNNLSLLNEVLDSALKGALNETNNIAGLLGNHVSMAMHRTLIALGKPVVIPEIAESLIKFTPDDTPCWLEWRECAECLLSEMDDQLKDEVGETLTELCESDHQIWERCQELLEESHLNDDFEGLLFGALYSRMVSGIMPGKERRLDMRDLYAIKAEGRRLYFRKDLASLVNLFQFVVSVGFSQEVESLLAYEITLNSIAEDIAGILFYYVDMLERYSDTEVLRTALLKMSALLGLFIDGADSIQDVKTLLLDDLTSKNNSSVESLPVSNEGSKILANSYAHLARCILPLGPKFRVKKDEIWRRYVSASYYFLAAFRTLSNSHTWSLFDSARDYNIDDFSRREVIAGECSKLSSLFLDILGELEKKLNITTAKNAGATNDIDLDKVQAIIDSCHIYHNALNKEIQNSDPPFLDYVKAVLAIEETISDDKPSERLHVIGAFTACYGLIHDLLRVSRYSRHLLQREGESEQFEPLYKWIDGGASELCRVLSRRWHSCKDEIEHLAQDCADGKNVALSRRTNSSEDLLYYCSLQNMLYLFDEMKVSGRGRGLHAERVEGSWVSNEDDGIINCLTVMNASYMNDPTEGRTLFQWLAGKKNKTILGVSVDIFRDASVSGRLPFRLC